MIFRTLYKTTGNWSKNKQPKNHLSLEDSLNALCGRKQPEWMGGIVEYKNGQWISEGVVIPANIMKKSTCAYCFAHATVSHIKDYKYE